MRCPHSPTAAALSPIPARTHRLAPSPAAALPLAGRDPDGAPPPPHPAFPPACGHGQRASRCACAARPAVVRSDVIRGGKGGGGEGQWGPLGTMGALLGSWW